MKFNHKAWRRPMRTASTPGGRADRLSIGVAMLMIAGAAVGFWLALGVLKRGENQTGPSMTWPRLGLCLRVHSRRAVAGGASALVADRQRRNPGARAGFSGSRRERRLVVVAAGDLPPRRGPRRPKIR